jgi:hypothetical protein
MPSIRAALLGWALAFVASGSASAQPHLVEVADLVGVQHAPLTRSMLVGAGVAIFDYDRDGRPDLLFADDAGPCHLYHNEPGGALGFTFRDVSQETGIAALCRGFAFAILDYDRDGWDDIAIGTSAGVVLLHNEGGNFVDRSGVAGLGGETAAATLTAADYDRDGYPDLYVGRYVTFPRYPVHTCGANRLYHNRGDGTFEDLSRALGADDTGCALAVSFVDLDGDGALDLFVGNDFGNTVQPTEMLRYDGERFQPMARAWGGALTTYAMGVAFGDVDGDGRLDFVSTNIGRNVLLRATASGFADDTETYGVALATALDTTTNVLHWRASWGVALADFDLDGQQDLYIASGYLLAESPIATSLTEPNGLFAGMGDRFALVPGEGDDPKGSRGVAIGDLDGDGVPDIVVSNIATSRDPDTSYARPSIYLGAPPAGRGFLSLRLVGSVSDLRAAGARVWATAGGITQQRDVDAGGASHASQHDATVLFGLGDAALATVRVRWPSGAVTTHGPLAANGRYTLEEPLWMRVPARMSVGATADLELTPLDEDGAVRGSGLAVSFQVSAGALVGPVRDLGDGRYQQTFQAPPAAAEVTATAQVEGVPMPARPRIVVRGADSTTIAVTDAPGVVGQSSGVHIYPRDATGVAIGAGHAVELLALSGTVGTAVDRGDGRYDVSFTPSQAGTVSLSARVDGVVQEAVRALDVVPAFDPQRSSTEAVYSIAAPGDRVLLRARALDGAGRVSAAIQSLLFVPSAGTLEPGPTVSSPGVATQWLRVPSTDAPPFIRVQASIGGVAIAHDAIIYVQAKGLAAPVAVVDAASSKTASFHAAIPADGQSAVRVMAIVRDTNGGYLPATPGTVFSTTGGSWRGPATSGLGNIGTRCLISPTTPGIVEVSASVSGLPLAGVARIYFHPATPGDPVQDGCGDDSFFPVVPEVPPVIDGGAAAPDAGASGPDGSVAADDGGIAEDGGPQDDDGGAASEDGGAVMDGGAEDDGGVAEADGGAPDAGMGEDDGGSIVDGGIAADAGEPGADGGAIEIMDAGDPMSPPVPDAGVPPRERNLWGCNAAPGGGANALLWLTTFGTLLWRRRRRGSPGVTGADSR